MSKTKNQERLETLNKRLDEISQKQLQNSDANHSFDMSSNSDAA